MYKLEPVHFCVSWCKLYCTYFFSISVLYHLKKLICLLCIISLYSASINGVNNCESVVAWLHPLPVFRNYSSLQILLVCQTEIRILYAWSYVLQYSFVFNQNVNPFCLVLILNSLLFFIYFVWWLRFTSYL